MSYLNKSERKKLILEVAKSIALDDGLAKLTVRNIAQKASLSVGLIHHHYSSIQELKAQVFTELAYQNLDISLFPETMSWHDKLLHILGFLSPQDELSYIRLWNEAEKISISDDEFSKVYWKAIETWKEKIIEILDLKKNDIHQINFDDLAWQLIGLTLGFERLSQLNNDVLSIEYISELVLQIVEKDRIRLANK